nr:unnamed protein product [Callosobruchus chinensis]
MDISRLNIPEGLQLADPWFSEPQVGSDYFWNVMCRDQITLGRNLPILQNTKFGWIVSGPLGNAKKKYVNCNFVQTIEADQSNFEIQQDLRQFWEIEEFAHEQPKMSDDETACENHFEQNTRRPENGAFIVKLPLKQDIAKLGETYDQARRRFLNLEKRLNAKPEHKKLYSNFMQEYLSMGHMSKVEQESSVNKAYYMGHHGVYREDSLTTALRVVFDASIPSSTGYSLNKLQMVGPTIQEDLVSILIRFRRHNFVVSADIAKMYRCVLVAEEDRALQRILWRFDSNEDLNAYELNTVTYGMAAASFLAIRCIFQLADENLSTHPNIARIMKSDFYVDDLLTGADTIESATRISEVIFKILNQGCFKLRKFHSNEQKVLDWLETDNDNLSKMVDFGEREQAKTLGSMWCPKTDSLMYRVKELDSCNKVTKRTILSGSSKIFDPLGLVTLCVMQIKILLQSLWLENVSWDDALPGHIIDRWNEFKGDVNSLNDLVIDRHAFCRGMTTFEIHAFCDASEKVYGACVYVKSFGENDNCLHLLTAKGKVAPLKTVSLPRLELCGALLAARLAHKGELKEGDMVIIKEDNLPPLKWKLGRVTSLHSGSDGVNRVATVKTLNGFVKRAFTKLFPLPLN